MHEGIATGVMPLKKILAAPAADIAGLAKLSAEAMAALRPELDPTGFFEALVRIGLLSDAVRFLAHALPKREAVWWACLCARDSLTDEPPPAVAAALQAAERWVYAVSEENRREAMARAEAAGFNNPASWAAVAAFWSGGSMAPPNAPVVPPGDGLTAAAVAGAILLAAVQREPERATEKYRQFIASGMDVADGGSGRKRQAGS
jgi:hypothetical protein